MISVKNLSKRYHEEIIFNNISFSVDAGKIMSIVGPFGCGKTTLLRIIAGLESNYSGSIEVAGCTPSESIRKRKIGFGFQRPNLLPWKSAKSNLFLPQVISGLKNKERVDNLLKITKLKKNGDKRIDELSGGMQQLLSIARSLALDPKVLLLDEPFSSIDEINRQEIRSKIRCMIKRTKVTAVVVTHSVEEAVYLSDYVLVLSSKPTVIKKIFPIKSNLEGKMRTMSETNRLVRIIKDNISND